MRDFPIFTTENGVASLVLREIPYRQRAYIKIIDSREPQKLLRECRQFCTAVGAEIIFAAGDVCLEKYPLHCRILEMSRQWEQLPETVAKAIPVGQDDVEKWRQIYNEKMHDVPNAAYMDTAGAKKMLTDGSGCFIYCGSECIGIGKGTADVVEAIASIVPGAGEDVLLALCNKLGKDHTRLQVADNNRRAIDLYKKMGFQISAEISRWHQIL